MTTVAFTGGILAADSRVTSGDEIQQGSVRKVFKLKNGTLIGFAGTLASIQDIMRKARKNPNGIIQFKNTGKDRDSYLHAIVIYPDGIVRELDDSGWTEIKAKHYAIGSGSTPALVAMECGKSAADAVRIAMKFDTKTGGRVHTVTLD